MNAVAEPNTSNTAGLRALAAHLRPGWSGYQWHRPQWGRLEWAFLLVALAAAAMRLWELGGRTMHYDEAIHLHFAWKLAQGTEFVHSPWMHGPLQIELVAVLIRTLGDTDFVARLPYALFGVALVILPYFLRRQIGAPAAICAAVILTLSPALLYFSRFGRNDILMAVWALLLLILLWRYTENSRARYLFGAAIVVALMLATKETAYFVILFMGLAAFGLAWRRWLPLLRRRESLAQLDGAAGFFVLLATLTLPQAMAAISVAQGPLGLTLAAHDTGATGETGAPVWAAPFVALPLWTAPAWFHAVGAALLVGGGLALAWWRWRMRGSGLLAMAVGITASATAAAIIIMRPFSGSGLLGGLAGADPEAGGGGLALWGNPAAAALLLGIALAALRVEKASWRQTALVAGGSALLAALWLTAFSAGFGFAGGIIPGAAAADIEAGRVAVNYLLPAVALLAALAAGSVVGVLWGGGVWLACAAGFYAVWTFLYTTFYTNGAGIFTGAWQSLGYWLAQQDVARGNQPWYYYAVGLTVYELLALAFGMVAVVWLLRRREPFGVVLALWTLATLAIYTIAAEKMPWLLVNITLPLSLTAATLLGHLLTGIDRARLSQRTMTLVALAPAWLAAAVWVCWLAARGDAGGIPAGLAALALLPAAVGIAYLMRGQAYAGRAVALGLAGLLLAFGTTAAVRAAYTYDDSSLELLAYAQGSSDLVDTYAGLRQGALADGAVAAEGSVKVDYDMWYPFQWYVRAETEGGALQYDRFCAAGSDDDDGGACRQVGADAAPQVYLAEAAHAPEAADAPAYRRQGPLRNLLWYPETYRRPGEARTETGMWQQLTEDVSFFRDAAADPEKWREAIEYIVARRQDSDWFKADFYQYTREPE